VLQVDGKAGTSGRPTSGRPEATSPSNDPLSASQAPGRGSGAAAAGNGGGRAPRPVLSPTRSPSPPRHPRGRSAAAPTPTPDELLDALLRAGGEAADPLPLKEWLELAEAWYIARTLQALRGNRAAAARALGIGRRTLYAKMHKDGGGAIEERWEPAGLDARADGAAGSDGR